MELTIILTLGFKKVYRKVADWLRKTQWGSLFLNLPIESEPYIKAYSIEEVGEKEFWNDYALLTGQSEPFINSLKYTLQPVLEEIKETYAEGREIHCYRDLESYNKETKILEKILLLEFRYRVTGKLDLPEWKKILFQEMSNSKDSWYRAVDRILEGAEYRSKNIILYEGYLDSLKYLRKPENLVEVVLLEDYWKSPLNILRTILWKHSFDEISDDEIERYLELQKKYIDLVINKKNVDEAHESWTQMVQKHHGPPNPLN